jgi:hypothetical protein
VKKKTFKQYTIKKKYKKIAIKKTPKSFNYSKEDIQEAFLKGLLEAYLKGNIKTKT